MSIQVNDPKLKDPHIIIYPISALPENIMRVERIRGFGMRMAMSKVWYSLTVTSDIRQIIHLSFSKKIKHMAKTF